MKWQPIETAPTDGTRVIVYCHRRGVVAPARYEGDARAKNPRPYWTHYGEYLFGKTETRLDQPTHWMPLPEPPND